MPFGGLRRFIFVDLSNTHDGCIAAWLQRTLRPLPAAQPPLPNIPTRAQYDEDDRCTFVDLHWCNLSHNSLSQGVLWGCHQCRGRGGGWGFKTGQRFLGVRAERLSHWSQLQHSAPLVSTPLPCQCWQPSHSVKVGGLALHHKWGESLHCALLLDYVPPEEPLGTPLGNTLRIRRPKLDWRGH